MIDDEKYMRRCLQLARNGQQNAKPNPMVGAVIVSADGRIIGEGYHVRCGEGHAEVNAFASVRAEDEPLLKEATIYVSLEPCSHYGKTPPCADLIIQKGVRRAVVGCQRPYIILKWAQTANGFIDDHFKPIQISNDFTKMLSHKLRAEEDAILVGRVTDERDKPQLTVREWSGANPKRLIIDRAHPLNLESLHAHQIQSLIVEGGAKTLQSFIDKGLWDELRVETNLGMTVTDGTRAPQIPATAEVRETIRDGVNQLVCYQKIIPES